MGIGILSGRKIETRFRRGIIAILATGLLLFLAGSVSAQTVSVPVAHGKKPKPTPTPAKHVDGESDWNGTVSSDFNTGGNWTPAGGSPGSAPPVAGDVAWLSSTPANKSVNLSNNTGGAGSLAGFYFVGTGASGYSLTSSSGVIKFTLTGISNSIGSLSETGNSTANAIRAENTSGTNTISAPLILGAAVGVSQYFYQVRGGTLVLNGSISSTNAIGGLQLRSAGSGTSTFTLAGANTYSGSTTVADANTALNIGNATALSNGALVLGANVVLDNTSGSAMTFTNNNPLTLSGGSLTFTGSNDLDFGTGAVAITGGNRSFTITAGTLTLGGNVSDGGANNSLTKLGPGTLVLNGTGGTYTGQTSIQAGTLSIASIKNLGVNSSIGAPTTATNGRIDIGLTTVTGTLTYTGTGDTTDRAIRMAGSTGGVVLDQSGTGLLKFTSDFTAANGTKTLTLQGSTSGTGELSGAIVNGGSGSVSVNKTGTGTWTLSGANTYTGGTTINQGTLTAAAGSLVSVGGNISVNSGGTLLLSGSGRHIGSGVGVALNGGTFNTGGLSEPGGAIDGTQFIGALTLTASSTINFGAGNSSVLEFAGLGTHTAGTILNITNWDGVPVIGGSGDRLLFNGLSTSFTTAYNQSDVVFDGVTGYTAIQIAAGGNPFYEVVGLTAAVPEPGTWFAGALSAIGVIGFSRRRLRSRLLRK